MRGKIILILCLFLTLISSASAGDIQKLLGAWECKTEEGTVTLLFKSEDRLVYNGEEIAFHLAPGVIQVADEFLGSVDYPYALSEGVLSITYPEGYTLNFKKAAVKPKTPPEKGASSDLVQYFSGTWKNYSQYTETMVVLYPDGTYGQRYTSNYGSEESGEAAGESHAQGRWTVRGTKEKGIITCTGNDGSTSEYEYQVHVENGEVYWSEYYFNRDLYGKVNE
jgi:hypothetical protein